MFRLLSYYLNKSGLNHNMILLCFGRSTDGRGMGGNGWGIGLESARKRGGNAPRIDDVGAGDIWIPLDGF